MVYVIKGLQLEKVGSAIDAIEGNFIQTFKMIRNSSERKYRRNVSISALSKFEPSDDFIYEYIVDEKMVVTIYSRRNKFNTVDLYVSEFAAEDDHWAPLMGESDCEINILIDTLMMSDKNNILNYGK